MKTINIRNKIVLGLILLTTLGCSKFEDGPKISFRSVERRIVGDYRIELFKKNGSDLTTYWNENYDLTFIFHNADDPSYYAHYMKVEGNIIVGGDAITFFSENDYSVTVNHNEVELSFQQHIDTTVFPNMCFYPLLVMPNDAYLDFTVSRLTKDQLWLTHTNGSDVYEIHFKE